MQTMLRFSIAAAGGIFSGPRCDAHVDHTTDQTGKAMDSTTAWVSPTNNSINECLLCYDETSLSRQTYEIETDDPSALHNEKLMNQHSIEKKSSLNEMCMANEVVDDRFKPDNQPEDNEVERANDIHLIFSLNKPRMVFDSDVSGTLHVYFLVIEGLSSTVSACPKNYQPQTLEMLFEMMRLASRTLGKRNTADFTDMLKVYIREQLVNFCYFIVTEASLDVLL
jgi:hypothetical protein